MTIRKVLLVDDDPDIRALGEICLRKVGGWEVVLADSGGECLRQAVQEQSDVILLDVMMPGVDGPATLSALREDGATASIPVLFLTARVRRHEVEAYEALGVAAVIAKPFDPMTLPDQIRRVVGG
jgi:CheY-like chemotaxis protein